MQRAGSTGLLTLLYRCERIARMLGYSPTGKRDLDRYDAAAWRAYNYFGSYERLAFAVGQASGEPVPGNSMRRWLQERRLPLQYATVVVDVTDGAVHLFDFFPWLRPYTQE